MKALTPEMKVGIFAAAVIAVLVWATIRVSDKTSVHGGGYTIKAAFDKTYQEVAAKYKGDAGAAAKLSAKVKAGGSGVWGAVPMPPNPQVPDADLKTMVAYILAMKK